MNENTGYMQHLSAHVCRAPLRLKHWRLVALSAKQEKLIEGFCKALLP